MSKFLDHLIGDWLRHPRAIKKSHPQSASALPRNLKRLREAKEWSVPELADRAKISVSTIRAMETSGNYNIPETGRAGGKGPTYDPNPTLSSLLAVAEALEVGIEKLVEEQKP